MFRTDALIAVPTNNEVSYEQRRAIYHHIYRFQFKEKRWVHYKALGKIKTWRIFKQIILVSIINNSTMRERFSVG